MFQWSLVQSLISRGCYAPRSIVVTPSAFELNRCFRRQVGHRSSLPGTDFRERSTCGPVSAGCWQDVHSASAKARPSYPPLMMVKVLLLRAVQYMTWRADSVPDVEEALQDRISFTALRAEAGSSGSIRHGDWRFDDQPLSPVAGHCDRACESKRDPVQGAGGSQLDERGLVLKEGTSDRTSTLVEGCTCGQRPSFGRAAAAKSPADPDADWTKDPPWEADRTSAYNAIWVSTPARGWCGRWR